MKMQERFYLEKLALFQCGINYRLIKVQPCFLSTCLKILKTVPPSPLMKKTLSQMRVHEQGILKQMYMYVVDSGVWSMVFCMVINLQPHT